MNFAGQLKFIEDLSTTSQFMSLRDCVLSLDWQNQQNLYGIDDPAFKDSGVIQFNFSKLMCHIRQPDLYEKIINDVIDIAMPVISQIKALLPRHSVLKSHFVLLNPGGKQVPHIDNMYYHSYCKRLVIPITSNSECRTYINNLGFNLSIGHLYEINNKVEHYSENLGNSVRTYMFVDMYDTGIAYILNRHYKFGSVV